MVSGRSFLLEGWCRADSVADIPVTVYPDVAGDAVPTDYVSIIVIHRDTVVIRGPVSGDPHAVAADHRRAVGVGDIGRSVVGVIPSSIRIPVTPAEVHRIPIAIIGEVQAERTIPMVSAMMASAVVAAAAIIAAAMTTSFGILTVLNGRTGVEGAVIERGILRAAGGW